MQFFLVAQSELGSKSKEGSETGWQVDDTAQVFFFYLVGVTLTSAKYCPLMQQTVGVAVIAHCRINKCLLLLRLESHSSYSKAGSTLKLAGKPVCAYQVFWSAFLNNYLTFNWVMVWNSACFFVSSCSVFVPPMASVQFFSGLSLAHLV